MVGENKVFFQEKLKIKPEEAIVEEVAISEFEDVR